MSFDTLKPSVDRTAGPGPWHPHFGGGSLPPALALRGRQLVRIAAALALVLGYALTGKALAQEPAMAVSQGMGHAHRANPYDGGSVYSAPAMVWLDGRFDIQAGVRFGADADRVYQVSAWDSQTSQIGLGIQWFRHERAQLTDPNDLPGWKKAGQEFDDRVAENVLAASIGTGGAHHLFGGAVGLRYYTRASPAAGATSAFNLAPSAAGIIGDQLYLTFTLENVIPHDDHPFTIGTGTRWQPTEQFGLGADLVVDLGTVQGEATVSNMLGAEFRIAGLVPVRAGWMRDGASGIGFVTGGVGTANEAVAFNYGARFAVAGTDEEELDHWHGLSLRVSF